jgi:hypothetical protein
MERRPIMTKDGFVVKEIVPIGSDVQWLCAVTNRGIVGTTYAAISGSDLRNMTDPIQVEILKAGRIEQAKRALEETE